MTTLIPHPDKPVWTGPYIGGITQSLIIRFLECPFSFYLYAYCGLKEPKPLDVQLIWGDILHKGLEIALRGDGLPAAKEAMRAYIREKYIDCPDSYEYTTWEMLKLYPVDQTIEEWGGIHTEVEIDSKIDLPRYKLLLQPPNLINGTYEPVLSTPRTIRARGKLDMLSYAEDRLGDHKAKGAVRYARDCAEELIHDLQLNLYAYSKNYIENWQYDLIQIPEQAYRVPDRIGVESSEHWSNRIFHKFVNREHGFPIDQHVHRWIYNIPHFQPKEKIERYFRRTIAPLMHMICDWWDYVTHPGFDPNDPECYNGMMYESPVRLFDASRTEKFKCHFHGILTERILYESLVPVEDFYSELSGVDDE